MQNVNESMCYETILTLVGEDYKKAYRIYSTLKMDVDTSYPLPSFSHRLTSTLNKSSEAIESKWRSIRDIYQKIKAEFEILDEKSPLFPKKLLESEYPVPFLYALGNIRFLEREKITVVGSLSPSFEAREIAKDVASFIKDSKRVLFTPLRLGISSIVLSETLKATGCVIVISSSFVTKAPNERLRDQMVDIYKKGGLIISIAGPARGDDKWHQVIRNRATSLLSDSIFLIEEKDGGPSWRIFDDAESDAVKMISTHNIGKDEYTFIQKHLDMGAIGYRDKKDLKKLIRKKEKKEKGSGYLDLTPDLF